MTPALDWTQPWLQPYVERGRRLLLALRHGQPLCAALNVQVESGWPRFAPQQSLPPGQGYESFIHANGQVPTRDHLHDLLNGLVWLHLPRTKVRMNRLQAAEIARLGIGPQRGRLRDVLTLFDENGALLLAPRAMWDALCARDWPGLFLARRGQWRQARLLVLGHGLLEQLQQPRKPLTAHVLPAPEALDSIAEIDRWLAGALDSLVRQLRPFAPLPVLGVPGWCAENAHESFYDDRLVFRRAGRSDVLEQRTLPREA